MPAYVPGFQYDVFLSYAQVAEPEWVEGFREKLQEQLDRELHQKGVASIFWDLQNLAGDSPLSAEITQALSNTATLVIVLSRAYRERPWCRKECESFLSLAGPSSRRTFVVLIEDIPPEQRPPEIQALEVLGFEFFEQHPESKKPGRHEAAAAGGRQVRRSPARTGEINRGTSRGVETGSAVRQDADRPPAVADVRC